MLTGITINSFFTYCEKFTLSPGESIKVADTTISLNDFVVLRNPDRSEKFFISNLSIGSCDRPLSVNKPIKIEKGLLYQWAYLREWEVSLYFPEIDFIYLGPGEETVRMGDYEIKLGPFIPDFAIIDKKIISLSDEALNPAIFVEYYKKGVFAAKQWVFYNEIVKPQPEDFEINCIMASFDENFKSTLKYIKSPGDFIIIFGIAVLFTGSILLLTKTLVKGKNNQS